jgi:hypothetical protein
LVITSVTSLDGEFEFAHHLLLGFILHVIPLGFAHHCLDVSFGRLIKVDGSAKPTFASVSRSIWLRWKVLRTITNGALLDLQRLKDANLVTDEIDSPTTGVAHHKAVSNC